jgi:hypothetical protein
MVASGSLASGLLLTDSYRVRLTKSASGLRAHTWETLLYVIPAGPVTAKAGSGNPQRRGGRWAIAGSAVPLAFTRTWHHCETGKQCMLMSLHPRAPVQQSKNRDFILFLPFPAQLRPSQSMHTRIVPVSEEIRRPEITPTTPLPNHLTYTAARKKRKAGVLSF